MWGKVKHHDAESIPSTLFEIFIFCPKIQLWFPEKIVDFFWWKTRENVVVLVFLAVDNFDFTRKIVKKIVGEKLVKLLGFCQYWIFGQKFDFYNSVRQATFAILCCSRVLKFSSKKKKKKAIAKISYFAKLEKVHSQRKVGLLSFSTEQ